MPRVLRLVAAMLAVALLAACNEVRSLQPAITAREAIEVKALEGSWRVVDTIRREGRETIEFGTLEIERAPGATPGYRVRYVDSTETEPWRHGRAGRIGDRTVLELRSHEPVSVPGLATRADTLPKRLVHNAYVVSVVGERLLIGVVRPDSALARVRSGRCPSPHVRDTTKTLTLSGTSSQVRAAYGCLLRLPAALDTFSISRVR